MKKAVIIEKVIDIMEDSLHSQRELGIRWESFLDWYDCAIRELSRFIN
jgi:hypothetical protein